MADKQKPELPEDAELREQTLEIQHKLGERIMAAVLRNDRAYVDKLIDSIFASAHGLGIDKLESGEVAALNEYGREHF